MAAFRVVRGGAAGVLDMWGRVERRDFVENNGLEPQERLLLKLVNLCV